MKLQVVLVEPMYEGNVGSIARVMKNFGFDELVLVNPCEIDDFGRAMASHARDIMEKAEVFSNLEEATSDASLVVGSTGIRSFSTDEHLRVPGLSPRELAAALEGKEGNVALLLGREDNGLSAEEIRICDMVVSVPTSEEYPIMNISHAAAVILYELSQLEVGKIRLASHDNLERFYQHAREMLYEIHYPEHKLEKTMLMFKRIFGRAMLTDREVQTLRGVLRSVQWQIGQKSEKTERNVK
jgi:tRNA/rRNA methyltransferase